MAQKQKKVKSNRKNKVFSISMMKEELDQVDAFLKTQKITTGFNMSRNELMRRCVLTHLILSKSENKDHDAAFRSLAAQEG